MIPKTFSLASAALAVILFAYPSNAATQNGPQLADASQCEQAIKDTLEARATNPEIGPKAAKAFDEIIELAKERCASKEFKNADELLQIARGMVASE